MAQMNLVALCILLCPVFFAAVISCTWLAVLIFRNHFSVPGDHSGSGGLPVGLLVAVQACAGDKLSVWFEHAHPLYVRGHEPWAMWVKVLSGIHMGARELGTVKECTKGGISPLSFSFFPPPEWFI